MEIINLLVILVVVSVFIVILTKKREHLNNCKLNLKNTNAFMANQVSNKLLNTNNNNIYRLNELLLN